MVDVISEEPMIEEERAYIRSFITKHNKGYFKFFGLVILVFIPMAVIIGVVGTLSPPETPLDKPFDVKEYIIIALLVLMLILGLTVFGAKRFSSVYKKDLRNNIKIILAIDIKDKQYVSLNNTYHFQLYYKYVKSIEVSQEDYYLFEIGDLIHVEIAKYSKTYLSYF
ncbi:MAG TPA: hypothetical protein PKX92_11295 [Edaphocola sp.]|nr:hypothetical protein [Edaphocola sp.]